MKRLLSGMLLLGAACGPTGQSDACKKWVACSDALPGSIKGSQDDSFGPNGRCWAGTSSDAATCTKSCSDAVAEQAKSATAPAECK